MGGEPGRVLLVEDDEVIRSMLGRYLVANGLAVAEAADGAQALEAVAAGPVDLVVLDTVLPGGSGLDVLRALRRTFSATDLPVVMATSRGASEDVVEALRLGANDYLTKPFAFTVALARVQTQLALKRSVEQVRRLEQSLARRNAELEEANARLTEANRRMRQDLEAAARVQQALLPEAPPEVAGASFAWRLRPCAELAGDSLNVVALGGRRVALYVLDVVGHGAKAALLAVMVSRVLGQMLAPTGPGPGEPAAVARRLNQVFPWDDRTQQFFSLLYGVLDMASGEFAFVSAGHPGPIHLPRRGPARPLEASGGLIGLGGERYKESRVELGPGDRLYLYTDGLVEATAPSGEDFGTGRLLAALDRGRAAPLADSLAVLVGQAEQWCSPHAPQDDLSVLAAEMNPDAS